jgi:predicted DNA-binding protein with PD1-like motif
MKSKLLDEQGEKTYILVFDRGDEVMTTLLDFARKNKLDSSHFTAIGAFSSVTLGYFELDRQDYKKIPVNEQVETLSLIGDISLEDGEPKVHAHVVVGKSDGSTAGGHLLEAKVYPTLEVVLSETPRKLRRKMNPTVGIALIDLDQS